MFFRPLLGVRPVSCTSLELAKYRFRKLAQMIELNMKDDQEKKSPTPIRLAEIDAQQKIMARVDELMTEAAQTKRSAPNVARPFWAQTQVDIPPSEQFGKLSQMTEDDRSPKDEAQPTASQETVPKPSAPSQATPQSAPQPATNMGMNSKQNLTQNTSLNSGEATALSAIRDEVINKMAAPAVPSADIEALLGRVEAIEVRIDKHQQDLTALLKLVRQLATKKDEKPELKKQTKRSESGGWGLGLLVTLLLMGGIIGWLFWMDSAFMMDMITKLVNEGLTMAIQLLAEFGAV